MSGPIRVRARHHARMHGCPEEAVEVFRCCRHGAEVFDRHGRRVATCSLCAPLPVGAARAVGA
jgi:hypothetical protein